MYVVTRREIRNLEFEKNYDRSLYRIPRISVEHISKRGGETTRIEISHNKTVA